MENILIQNPFLQCEEGIVYNTITNSALFAMDSHRTHYIIKEGTTYIGAHCFSFCFEMEGITLPASLLAIGNAAFEHCTNLEEIHLPSSLRSLGNKAFNNSGIVKLELPAKCSIHNLSLYSSSCMIEKSIKDLF